MNRLVEHGAPLLLVLDFPGYRTEARVRDLRLDEHGLRVHELLRHPLPRETTGAAYIRRLLSAHPVPAVPVAAVLAYCASAPLALELAEATAGRQRHLPQVILFDAVASTRDAVRAAHRDALARLGPVRAGEETADPAFLSADPDYFVEAAVRDVERKAVDLLRADGATAHEATESAAHMAGGYADWLTHLVAAPRSRASSWSGNILRIASADHPRDAFPVTAHRVEDVQVDCAREHLLRDEGTRTAVLSFLAATAPPAPVRSGTDGDEYPRS
ncbi:hypothetical protein OG948_00645 [Embleya sp. NBC_00888]|uniref:hypothetical protein n=1 Tax=Embleya sp. NBC_00888 TaxID=2975960 RepID=UPI00386BB274|nr:hypothetical protein OG948_00645 [Embleya sp. NBC_00888]